MNRRCLLACLGLVIGWSSACKPNYPQCDNDEHCTEKGEVCIDKQCQECGADSHCAQKYGEGRECASGRCELKPECKTQNDCGEGLACKAKKCVPECQYDHDCAEGRTCGEGRCLAQLVARCDIDIDCGPGRTCIEGTCQDFGTSLPVAARCQPEAGAQKYVQAELIFFGFDQYDLNESAQGQIKHLADCLTQAPRVSLVIEGHADERGTQEYNLALGEKRAVTVETFLKNLGVKTDRLRIRSKGANEPLCQQASEDCWGKNRRVVFIQALQPG